MDLDPMKRKLVTRIIGISDMFLGGTVLVFNLHTMWEYYLHDVKKSEKMQSEGIYILSVDGIHFNVNISGRFPNIDLPETEDELAEQLVHLKLPLYSFVLICIMVFGLNLVQIFMGFALQIATFGRAQQASINIAKCWLRVSTTLLFFVVLKIILVSFAIVYEDMEPEWTSVGLALFEIFFRIFSSLWIPKFIQYLKCQSDFDSRCHVFSI